MPSLMGNTSDGVVFLTSKAQWQHGDHTTGDFVQANLHKNDKAIVVQVKRCRSETSEYQEDYKQCAANEQSFAAAVQHGGVIALAV